MKEEAKRLIRQFKICIGTKSDHLGNPVPVYRNPFYKAQGFAIAHVQNQIGALGNTDSNLDIDDKKLYLKELVSEILKQQP